MGREYNRLRKPLCPVRLHPDMIRTHSFLASILLPMPLAWAGDFPEPPEGFGQLEKEPAMVDGGRDEQGREFSYLAQPAVNGKLVLTASNGFFSGRVATARGVSDLPKVGDAKLIAPNFASLDWLGGDHSLRWHVLIKKPGEVFLSAHLGVTQAGSIVKASLGSEHKMVTTAVSDAGEGQPWELRFQVDEPGEYLLSLQAKEVAGRKVGDLHRIEVFGPAVEGASLLRARWRPAAAHGNYDTSEGSDTKLLVFSTRSEIPASSYSPITTPFGYYGTSFDDQGRSTGSFNFSMWGKPNAAGDLKVMPHLLGVGSPDGEFSGFGHEGSGVKPRGWQPMPDRPEEVVQALRVESGKEYDTYYGYYYDHPSEEWKFFAAGNKWHGGKPMKRLRLGSFCEVPGPPQLQRSGDVYREVRRRGWAWDGKKWIALDEYRPGGTGRSGDVAVNKRWYTTEDGEFAMGCGGIRFYQHDVSRVRAPEPRELPGFLTDESTDLLFRMPVEVEVVKADEVGSDRVTVGFTVKSEDELTGGTVFFGESDALTFAPRKLHGTERKSELSHAVNAATWSNAVELSSVKQGANQVVLEGLEPDRTYLVRILVDSRVSRVWSSRTFRFRTAAAD